MVVFTFFFVGATPALSGSRIMPTGSVKVYEGGKLVQVLKQESALPDGAMLTTEGKCGVHTEDFFLVADDGCTFSIIDGVNRKDLRVDSGVVYFAITQKTGKLSFITPAGVISTQRILFNADSNGGLVKGYLDVSKSQVQLGVLEGGSMVVNTANGNEKIIAGKQITLSMADPIGENKTIAAGQGEESATPAGQAEESTPVEGQGDVAAGGGAFSDIPAAYFAGGAVLVGAAIVGISNANSSDDSSPSAVSPASP